MEADSLSEVVVVVDLDGVVLSDVEAVLVRDLSPLHDFMCECIFSGLNVFPHSLQVQFLKLFKGVVSAILKQITFKN